MVDEGARATKVFNAKFADLTRGVARLEEMAPRLKRAYVDTSQSGERAYLVMLAEFKAVAGAVAESFPVLGHHLDQHEQGIVRLQIDFDATMRQIEAVGERFASVMTDMDEFFVGMDNLDDHLERELKTQQAKKNGCYVATAVYGSYDCPEVWVLRRFRDETLARTQPGRALIRVYYALSPVGIRVAGPTVPKFGERPLGALVDQLRKRGYADTPYVDPKRRRGHPRPTGGPRTPHRPVVDSVPRPD